MTSNEDPWPFLPQLHREVLVFLLLMRTHLAGRLLTIHKEVVSLLFVQLALKAGSKFTQQLRIATFLVIVWDKSLHPDHEHSEREEHCDAQRA